MNISDNLRLLIHEANAFDKAGHYINFDHIWQDPHKLKLCAEIIGQHLQLLVNDIVAGGINKSNLVLLTPDNIGGSLGILPISFLVAEKLELNIAVWKEYADVRWGTSAILGYREANAVCILLQDVVDQGTTAIRVAQSIKELTWKFPVYSSVVLNSENEKKGVMQSLDKVSLILGERPVFRNIISIKELVDRE